MNNNDLLKELSRQSQRYSVDQKHMFFKKFIIPCIQNHRNLRDGNFPFLLCHHENSNG